MIVSCTAGGTVVTVMVSRTFTSPVGSAVTVSKTVLVTPSVLGLSTVVLGLSEMVLELSVVVALGLFVVVALESSVGSALELSVVVTLESSVVVPLALSVVVALESSMVVALVGSGSLELVDNSSVDVAEVVVRGSVAESVSDMVDEAESSVVPAGDEVEVSTPGGIVVYSVTYFVSITVSVALPSQIGCVGRTSTISVVVKVVFWALTLLHMVGVSARRHRIDRPERTFMAR